MTGAPEQQPVSVEEAERVIGYRFSNPRLLEQALTHTSYAEEFGDGADNQRLEFLGDTIVGVVVSRRLYEQMPDAPEGVLSKARSRLVSTRSLADVAREQGLGRLLRLGVGEERTSGRTKSRLLADVVEAIAGAVFLDGGLPAAEAMLLRWMSGRIARSDASQSMRDFKSALQEWTQARAAGRPVYELLRVTGPAHEQSFHVAVHVRGAHAGEATGGSKKEAEQNAARVAYEALTRPSSATTSTAAAPAVSSSPNELP